MIQGNDIVDYARTWIGVKWKHQGRLETGIDCAGLLIRICQNFGMPAVDRMGYSRAPDGSFKRAIEEQTLQGDKNNILHGSIGIFRDTALPCHTGIFTTDQNRIMLIHSDASLSWRRVHEEEFIPGSKLHKRLVSVRLFKDVEYDN